jgi:hypothetical protein
MRRHLLSFALAASLSALGAAPALARGHHHGKGAPEGAQKAPLFGPEGLPESFPGACEGGTTTAKTFGFAILNTPGNEATLSGIVALKGAAPNTTYNVAWDQASTFGCSGQFFAQLHTNGKGNGNLAFRGIERNPEATKFFVIVSTGEFPVTNGAFISRAVELD